MRRYSRLFLLGVGSLVFGEPWAGGVPGRLEEVTVNATRQGKLLGSVDSASQGTVLADQLDARPVLRTGEVLEVVPGLIVTQHSGDGKANQYFLRGFNLDHGTDFATRVEGMPVNMPTHAHGQGYSDINFMIPELIDRIEYKKGTYYAEEGNFSAAGAADIRYRRRLDRALASVSGGENGYLRALLATAFQSMGGDLLVALDSTRTDGPWKLDEDLRKLNAVAKYTRGTASRGFTLEGMTYDGRWRSTDQIPLRAVADGRLDRFSFIDPSDGGKTHRYSLSGSWWNSVGAGRVKVQGYGVDYGLDLFSNFTYFTAGPDGDQFEQFDRRRICGGDAAYSRSLSVFGHDGEFLAGIQSRHDDIAPVALYLTQARRRFGAVREDQVRQTSYSAYLSQAVRWTPWFKTEVGLRADRFDFAVDSNLAQNSGKVDEDIVSPKFTAVFGPWAHTELFLNWGQGFHSNDARGATIKVDPTDGISAVDAVTPLVKAWGQEFGLRSALKPQLQLAASVWTLQLDSELLFVGDGGTTEARRASRRTGVEFSAFYTPLESLIVDADLAWSHSRFTDFDPAGDRIPNAIERVASIGIAYNRPSGFFGGARLRYLGPGPLVEDNSVRSPSTTLLNVNVGYHLGRTMTASLALLNALDEKANDITYYYASQLPGEADPVDDVHFHPAEPRQVRVTLTARF